MARQDKFKQEKFFFCLLVSSLPSTVHCVSWIMHGPYLSISRNIPIECKLIQPLWKTVWKFLKKLGLKPPYDPATPLLGIYPEETKTEKDTRTPVFIASLFTIARTWKQPRCPSTDEWIKKFWYIYTMDY